VARVMCIANQKGGVGKTTTAMNLGVGLAMAAQRTLLIDLDPQCNATSGLGCAATDHHPLLRDQPLQQSILHLDQAGLDLLPGSRSFQDVEALAAADQSERLAAHISGSTTSYDYVLIDCPPSLGRLTQTALATSSEVMMPLQCEYFAMEGLTQIIEVIRDVMNRRPGRLQFGGILLTMYDHTLELTAEVDREVREFFGEIVFDAVIPRDVAVSEAPSHGKSVLQYAPRSRGARAYVELCMEVLDHE